MQQSKPANHYTAKPEIAGIMNIIIGSFYLLGAVVISFGILLFLPSHGGFFSVITANSVIIVLLAAIPVAVLGILAIVGGKRNLKRENWILALSGSIAAALFSIIGIVSIVLTAISKNEFDA